MIVFIIDITFILTPGSNRTIELLLGFLFAIFLLLGIVLLRQKFFLVVDRATKTASRQILLLGIFLWTKKIWNLDDVASVKFKTGWVHDSEGGSSKLTEIFINLKDGQSFLIMRDSSGNKPVNCVKYLNLFIKGEYATLGVYSDTKKMFISQ